MLFENEKDNIDDVNELNISEDGSVNWEDVLADSDDLVSIKEEASKSNPDKTSAPKETSSINLGDELELIPDVDDDDVNDEELAKILSEDTKREPMAKKAFDAFGTKDSSIDSIDDSAYSEDEINNFDLGEDFELSSDENSFNNETSNNDIDLGEIQAQNQAQKVTAKKSPNPMTLLLALLFAVLVAGGVYFILDYTKDKNVNDEALVPQTQQELMDNLDQEKLAQRTQENIPVVNEDEVNEIKPDEAQKEEAEKKEVVNIVPTGRSNPFMPIQKYIAVEIPEKIIKYDKTGIPMPPEEYGQLEDTTTKLMQIAVSGIMYDGEKSSAIITFDNNDYFVQKGDRIDDYRVVAIGKNYVAIALGKNIYKANVGEEFKITSDFYGSAKYLPSKQGGGRQYQSVGSENNSNNRQYGPDSDSGRVTKSSVYTSENDVVIRPKK